MDALAIFTAWSTISTCRALAGRAAFAIAGVDVSFDGKSAKIRAFDEEHESCSVVLLEDGSVLLERYGETFRRGARTDILASRIVGQFNARVEQRGLRESVSAR